MLSLIVLYTTTATQTQHNCRIFRHKHIELFYLFQIKSAAGDSGLELFQNFKLCLLEEKEFHSITVSVSQNRWRQ
jgi:hypothetical protein